MNCPPLRHRLIPLLADDFQVVCPDMRGFGWTDAPASGYDKEGLADDLLAVCNRLGLERFALAGHDWGGFVTSWRPCALPTACSG